MAITVRTSPANQSGNASSVAFTRDASVVAGDLRLVFIFTSSGVTMPSPPSGWTVILDTNIAPDSTRRLYVISRVYVAGDASSVTVTFSGSTNYGVAQVALGGALATVHAGPTRNTGDDGTGTTQTAPSLTSTVVNTVLVCFYGQAAGGSTSAIISLPSGMTNLGNSVGNGSQGSSTRLAWENRAAAGATGTRVATCSNSGKWAAVSVLVAPAATTQNITGAGAISSAEAFGTPASAQTVGPAGAIATAGAFGTPALAQTVVGAGIASAEAFGTAVLAPGNVSVGPAGAIGSGEAVPAPVVSPAPVTVSPGGIGTTEALGILVITTGQAIQPGGIGPAEAFGTPVLTPGSVAVGPAGVGSAEAFGGPALAPVVQPTGVASGGAFGTAALAQTVVVAGIGPGEAFGAPTAAPGPVTAAPTGIASGGAFGTARLDLTILPVGLASGGAFGTAELLRGAVSLAPTGIPSAGAFGSPALYARIAPSGIPTAEALGTPQLNLRIYPVGIASEEVFGATGGEEVELASRRIPQRLLARYELVCVARIPQTTGAPALLAVDPVDWSSLTWVEELSRPQTLSATCKISKLTDPVIQRLQTPHELPTELWLYRNGKLIVAGPMLGWSVSGEEVTIEAQGLLAYAFMMFVTADLVYSATDQFAIVRGLIDHWQNLEYGNFGIDTSEPSLSGFVRDATFLKKELTNVGKAITDLSAGADGFDVLIDPASRKLQLFYPRQGIDRSTGEDAIVFDSRNVTSSNVACSIAPGDVATESIGTGSNTAGEGLYATAANLELRAKYGRSAVAATFDSADQATLDSQVGGLLNARDQVLLIPGTNTRVTVDADLASYDIGDTISYQLHGRLSVQSAFRIRKRSVSVAQTGTEAVSFEFA